MEIKKIKVYSFEELSKEAKEKVLNDFRENNEYHFLEEYLKDFLKERLKEVKIKEVGETKLYYSLSYSQGDGCCFIGLFEWKNYNIKITHNFRYYHSKSVDFEITQDNLINDVGVKEEADEEIYKEFKKLYENVCYEVEKTGYNFIEAENSEETIKENIEANEYLFYSNGEIYKEI